MGIFQFGKEDSSLLSIPQTNSLKMRHSKILALTRVFDSGVIYVCLHFALQFNGEFWTFDYLATALVAALVFGLCAELLQVYNFMRGLTTVHLTGCLVWSWICTIAVMYPSIQMTGLTQALNEEVLLVWALLTILLLVSSHLLRRRLLSLYRNRKHRIENVGIVGANPLGIRLYNTLENMPWLGCNPVGFYDDRADLSDLTRRAHLQEPDYCGSFSVLKQDVDAGKIDTVYIVLPMSAEKRVKKLVDGLADSTVTAYLIPDVFCFDLLHARLTSIRGIPAVSIYDSPLEEHGFSKRALDIILSLFFIAVTAIPMLLIALAVKFTSPGPVLFKQTRYGFGGKEVKVWKFRSMTVCEDGDKVTQATKGDARITPVGAFIRRTSLDELPQFFNALMGTMSIVGPRPHAVSHNEYYRQHIKGYMLRHKVKPGITGLAQINGFRGETAEMADMAGRVHYDLEYIRSWTLWSDIKIIFLTVFKGFIDKKAY